MKNKLNFTLTGNFQYDLGILGLKRVLDFFGFRYEWDDYSITINKNEWKNIGKCAYFYGYYFNGLEKIRKKFDLKQTELTEDNFKDKILSTKDKDFEKSIYELSQSLNINGSKKIAFASYPALSVFNVSHLNVFNPSYLGQAQKKNKIDFFYNLYINKFNNSKLSNSLSIKTCDFCQEYEGEPLNRNNFLFASSAINQGWFEKQNIHICSYCSALNLFATYGTVVTNTGERLLIYSSNLKNLDIDNKILANTFEEIVSKYLEEIKENENIKVEANVKSRLFIRMNFSSQNPDMDFLPFSSEIIGFFLEKKDLINKLKQNDFVGFSGKPIVYGYKDTIKSIISGEDLFYKADFIVNCIIKQKSGNKDFKGFDDKSIKATLLIIQISNELKGGNMKTNLNEFFKFGNNVRKKLYAEKEQNAARNKAISFASFIRESVNESKEKFMEALLQLSIYSQLSIPQNIIESITDPGFNYKEAGLVIALALMSIKEEKEE